MIKKDFAGLLHIYGVPGTCLIFCVWFLFIVINSIRRFWVQDDFAYHLFDVLIVLLLLFSSIFSIFLLVRAYQKWLRLEYARNNSAQFPIYEFWRLYRSGTGGDGTPPALKMMMARSDVMRIIQVLAIIFFLLFLIGLIIALIAVANTGHSERFMEVTLVLVASFIGMVIVQSPVVCLIILLDYERVEASEQGLLIQRGLIRRFIAWEEVRLFAIRGITGSRFEWIELAGTKARVRRPFSVLNNSRGRSYTYLARESPASPYQPISSGMYREYLWQVMLYVQRQTDQPLRDLRL